MRSLVTATGYNSRRIPLLRAQSKAVVTKKQTIWLTLALLAVFVAYANSFNNGFHFDDFHTVTDNPAIRSLGNTARFFTDTSTFSVLPANRTYRPMVSLSLALDYAMGRGYTPLWFHVGTFLLLLLLVVLLAKMYGVVFEKTQPGPANGWLALGAAAWFGLHPAIAETVNYVIQRGDLYCTLGCVGALVVYATWPKRRRYGLYLLPLVFAMLSKPPAAVFPVLLFAYVWFFEPTGERRRLKVSALAVVPSVVAVGLLLGLQSAMTPKTFLPSILSPWDYRLVQPFVWLRYFGALFLPLHLNVDTDLGPVSDVFDPRALVGLLFLAALCAAIWFTARRRRLYPIAFGLVWFVVTQLPTSLYPLSEVENDHRMFFSFVGLIAAVVWAGWLLVERLPLALRSQWRTAGIAFVVLALSGYAWGTHVRNQVWHDEESLWLDDVQKSPHNGRGLMDYGLTQMNKGAYPQALDYFTRALPYTPNYPSLEINLGIVNGAMADQGDASRTAEAEKHFARAIALAPNDDGPHAFYGRWLIAHGRLKDGIAEEQAAISLNPARSFQRDQLIDAYNRSGDADAAHQAAMEALGVASDDAVAQQALVHPPAQTAEFWINLSLTQSQQGAYAESIESARHALTLDPRSAIAYNNIGAGYAAMQRWDEAVQNERQALKLNPNLAVAQNNLKLYLQHKVSDSPAIPPSTDELSSLINESLRLNQQGNFADSLAVATEAAKQYPDSPEAWNNIAANDEALHRWDAAIAAAQKAVALRPDFQLAKNNLAWSISQKKLGVR
jgi:tetratricopeptide (TPR) repeat protein